jgi:hypothetical protein
VWLEYNRLTTTTRPKDVSSFFGFDDLTNLAKDGRVNNNPTGQKVVDNVSKWGYNTLTLTQKELKWTTT